MTDIEAFNSATGEYLKARGLRHFREVPKHERKEAAKAILARAAELTRQ